MPGVSGQLWYVHRYAGYPMYGNERLLSPLIDEWNRYSEIQYYASYLVRVK